MKHKNLNLNFEKEDLEIGTSKIAKKALYYSMIGDLAFLYLLNHNFDKISLFLFIQNMNKVIAKFL